MQELTELEKYLNNRFQTKTLKLSAESELFTILNTTAFKTLANHTLKNMDIQIYKPLITITDKSKIIEILHNNHSTPTAGHIGQSRMYKKLREIYKWKNMKKTIANYIKNCSSCTKNKHQKQNRELLEITTTPTKVFDTMSIDTVGPFTKTNQGNKYAVTMQCDLSKYVIIIPIPNKEANTVARAIVHGFILNYGPMNKIKTDLGTEYKNQVFSEICKLLKIEQIFATPAHPETIGALERNHKCLNEYLRSFVNENKDDWDDWVQYYSFCYNTSPNSIHGYTPFELVFGKKVNIPSELSKTKPEPIYNYDLYNNELKYRLQNSISKAKQLLEKAKKKTKNQNDPKCNPLSLKIGDQVLLSVENRRKLDPLYEGPYSIISIDNVNCLIKDQDNKISKIHKNRLRRINK